MIRSEATPKSSKVLISVLLAQSKFDPNLIMSFMISRSGLDFMAKMIKTYILCESEYCNEKFQYHAISCDNVHAFVTKRGVISMYHINMSFRSKRV